jgi:hypothetical protein
MTGWIEYLTSSRGMPFVNGIACAIFVASILVAVFARRVSLGSAIPQIKKSENPRAFWSVLFLFGVIAAWTGVTAATELLMN